MRCWWVNQNQTYKHEVQGGFLWSPKRNRNGGRNQFYENMTAAQPGDLVLSFADTQIKAVGVVQGRAESAVKPNFGSVGDQWENEGWLVPVEFRLAERPVAPRDFVDELRPHLPAKYAPLQPNGNGNQGVYLAQISPEFTTIILGRMGLSIAAAIGQGAIDDGEGGADDHIVAALQGRGDIGSTQKEQLVLARRGQGVFRANVRLNERGCRLTGVADPRFLVASHIKPWRDCTDAEKLDGCNGLLLSPHADRLFDRGMISFENDGAVLKSPKLPVEVWSAWGFQETVDAGPFSNAQAAYLRYHRDAVFCSQ